MWCDLNRQVPELAEFRSWPSNKHAGPVIPQHPQSTKLLNIHAKWRTFISPNEPARQTLKETTSLRIRCESVKSSGYRSKGCDELLHTYSANEKLFLKQTLTNVLRLLSEKPVENDTKKIAHNHHQKPKETSRSRNADVVVNMNRRHDNQPEHYCNQAPTNNVADDGIHVACAPIGLTLALKLLITLFQISVFLPGARIFVQAISPT